MRDFEIKGNHKGNVQPTKTDRESVYRFFFLAPSFYVLSLSHDGFRKESREVDVLPGPPGAVNVTLDIAEASSEVTVIGEAPLIHQKMAMLPRQ